MRWSVGKQISPRGAGLGNEIFPWAKAYLAAQALGLNYIDPPWRLNPRRYDRQLKGGTWDSTKYLVSRALPAADITRDVYRSTGHVDYYQAMLRLTSKYRDSSRPVLLHSSGMSGGYLAIRRARIFLRHSILGSQSGTRTLTELEADQDPAVRVAVHVRAGDFQERHSVQANVFNQTLPIEWYKSQLETLQASLDVPIRIYLATDGRPDKVVDALAVGSNRPIVLGTTSISDLAVLAGCDLLISSVSSFSMLAAFLSDAPYVWHRDQLGESGGWLSIWGHEHENEGGGPTRAAAASMTINPSAVHRGYAHSMRPHWAPHLLRHLEHKAQLRLGPADLIQYGVVPGEETQK